MSTRELNSDPITGWLPHSINHCFPLVGTNQKIRDLEEFLKEISSSHLKRDQGLTLLFIREGPHTSQITSNQPENSSMRLRTILLML